MKNNKEEIVKLRIEEKEKEKLLNYCKNNSITISKLLREFIAEKIAEEDKAESQII